VTVKISAQYALNNRASLIDKPLDLSMASAGFIYGLV